MRTTPVHQPSSQPMFIESNGAADRTQRSPQQTEIDQIAAALARLYRSDSVGSISGTSSRAASTSAAPSGLVSFPPPGVGATAQSPRASTALASTPSPRFHTPISRASTRSMRPQTAEISTQTESTDAVELDNLPLHGWAKLKEAIAGKDGIWGGIKALGNGRASTALSNICRSLITTPIYATTALLDAPRKLGDVAAAQGTSLVTKGEASTGLLSPLKAFAGGLIQVVGGAVRLTKPLIGLALVSSGPAGLLVGGLLIGLWVTKEAMCIVNDQIDEMQIIKFFRDIASGTGAVAGALISPITQGIAKLFKPAAPAVCANQDTARP